MSNAQTPSGQTWVCRGREIDRCGPDDRRYHTAILGCGPAPGSGTPGDERRWNDDPEHLGEFRSVNVADFAAPSTPVDEADERRCTACGDTDDNCRTTLNMTDGDDGCCTACCHPPAPPVSPPVDGERPERDIAAVLRRQAHWLTHPDPQRENPAVTPRGPHWGSMAGWMTEAADLIDHLRGEVRRLDVTALALVDAVAAAADREEEA